jgi:hypothetical protein
MSYGRLAMLTLNSLSLHIEEYRNGGISLDDFEDWFRDNSRGAYRVPEVSEACASVEAAFSRYYFQGVGEDALRMELANTIRPFASLEVRPLEEPVILTASAALEISQLIDAALAAQSKGKATGVSSQQAVPVRMPMQHAEQWDPLWDTGSATQTLPVVTCALGA